MPSDNHEVVLSSSLCALQPSMVQVLVLGGRYSCTDLMESCRLFWVTVMFLYFFVDRRKVDGKPGGELGDTELIHGIVIDKEFSHAQVHFFFFAFYSCRVFTSI